MGFEMAGQAPVVVEPPEGGARDHEELGAGGPQRSEMTNGGIAVGRIGPRVGAVVGQGEMPRAVGPEAEQLLVALADDEHGGRFGDGGADLSVDRRSEGVVLRGDAAVVAVPADRPLVLEALTVLLEQARV